MIPDINLLPNLEKDHANSKVLYILVGSVVLLLLAFFIWQFFSAKASITTLQSEETNLLTERDALLVELESYSTIGQNSLEQSVEFVELISYPVSPLIDETQRLQPNNSYLRDYSFSESSLSMTVDFETLSDLSAYISRLSKSAYFLDVQVASVTNFEPGNETDTELDANFDVIPRQSAQIQLFIDNQYLAIGGGVE